MQNLFPRTIHWRKLLFPGVLLIALVAGLMECIFQLQDSLFVRKITASVISQAQATDNRAKVIAIRDYLRARVSWQGLPVDGRPFLRGSAADTLRTGKGYCGEVSRAFIVMADAVGIRAQRINLYGKAQHVVAEAELSPGNRVIVDCQNPPRIADLEPLDQVILRPEYDDYYTLNLRRLHLNWLVTRIKLEMGPLAYWTENPHALKALFWFLLAAVLLLIKGLRLLVRAELKRRGWLHVSDVQALQESVQGYGQV
jgi:hypothetical protein